MFPLKGMNIIILLNAKNGLVLSLMGYIHAQTMNRWFPIVDLGLHRSIL
jgi:hypothetical protein